MDEKYDYSTQRGAECEVEPEVFAAVQEQLRENQRHARQSRRGALYLLQGLVQCQHCGYTYCILFFYPCCIT